MRFNVNLDSYAHLDNNDLDWLNYRLELASLTAIWSLKQQTLQDFRLVVLLNEQTPRVFLSTLAKALDGLDVEFLLSGRPASQMSPVVADALGDLHRGSRFVQTTRLDSDDALHPEYLAAIDRTIHEPIALDRLGAPLYITFPIGQQFVSESMEYTRRDYPTNPFGTLIERTDGGIRTVHSHAHTKLLSNYDSFAAARCEGMWCTVIHGTNLVNVRRGATLPSPFFEMHPDLAQLLRTPAVQPPERTP